MARLLLVDDRPANLITLEALLEPLGHELLRASTGQAALDVFGRGGVDLVLLDVRLPDLDGVQVLERMRAGPSGEYVPVILITGLTEREHRRRGLEAGADEFLEKPVDPAVLLARVRTLLGLKAARDDLAARNESLERLQREQRELGELIVHDLKNPLAVVQLGVDGVRSMLRRTQPTLAHALDEVAEAADRMQTLVGDLLLIARLERADWPLRRQRIALHDLLGAVAEAHRREASALDVTLDVDVEDDVTVAADPVLIRRLVENLVENALRYAPRAGRVAIAARAGLHVEITVANTGPPIPPSDRPRLFEKFWRAADDAAAGHAGLGLYFCKRATEVHGGTIAVRETPEWPTEFVVALPARSTPSPSGTAAQ